VLGTFHGTGLSVTYTWWRGTTLPLPHGICWNISLTPPHMQHTWCQVSTLTFLPWSHCQREKPTFQAFIVPYLVSLAEDVVEWWIWSPDKSYISENREECSSQTETQQTSKKCILPTATGQDPNK
jgi:hypothetical protein